MIHNLYRYEAYFKQPDEALQLFGSIPFLNGGLFECLDKPDPDDPAEVIRIDGFSDRPDNELTVPDDLFFGAEREVDLNEVYGTHNQRYKVRGLIDIFQSYKFTIEENTPIEEDVALDPELLGRVFENLLAAYNPETGVTARKQTGSFYTPREIVDYMVDESLIAYLQIKLIAICGGRFAGDPPRAKEIAPAGLSNPAASAGSGDPAGALEARLRHLLAYNAEPHRFNEAEVACLIEAIDALKLLDPAAGSGAFPMGYLHKLVFILGKLDPGNARWQEKQIAKASEIEDSMAREAAIAGIEQAFERHHDNYGRKLYLIQNCIYGVDIQPIAVQIAKLRCFLSLVVDQKTDDTQPNRGILPLPNLETNFVAANTLITVDKPAQPTLYIPDEIEKKEKELADVRRKHFSARTLKTKNQYREKDAALRAELADLLKQQGFPPETTLRLAYWNPYDQNAFADFFDPEWMFGIAHGFDVVAGNPPYVRQEQIKELKPALQAQYECYTGTADLYVYFYERGYQLLRDGGVLTYISSNKYFRSGYGEKLRRFLSQQATIHQLIDFGDAPVFTAIAYPSIIVLEKKPANKQNVRALTWKPGPPIAEFDEVFRASSFLLAQKELTPDGWKLESSTVLRLLDKLRSVGKPLGEYVNGRLYRGILTGLNEAFVVDRETRDRLIAEHKSSAEILKPFLRGRDVKRWRVEYADQYLIKIESSENVKHPWSGKPEKEAEKIFAKTYPAIHAWFQGFREGLINRDDQGHYFWELRSCAYWQEFGKPKIIYPNICKRNEFAWDDEKYCTNQKAFIIPRTSKYLLGVLNSSVVMWLFRQLLAKLQNEFYEPSAIFMRGFPIPVTTDPGSIEKLVDKILAAKRANSDADVSAWEREIDRLVYQLYGLTEEEIEIVEVTDR